MGSIFSNQNCCLPLCCLSTHQLSLSCQSYRVIFMLGFLLSIGHFASYKLRHKHFSFEGPNKIKGKLLVISFISIRKVWMEYESLNSFINCAFIRRTAIMVGYQLEQESCVYGTVMCHLENERFFWRKMPAFKDISLLDLRIFMHVYCMS